MKSIDTFSHHPQQPISKALVPAYEKKQKCVCVKGKKTCLKISRHLSLLKFWALTLAVSLKLGKISLLNTDLTHTEICTQTHFFLSVHEVLVQGNLQRSIPISQAQDKGGSAIEGTEIRMSHCVLLACSEVTCKIGVSELGSCGDKEGGRR